MKKSAKNKRKKEGGKDKMRMMAMVIVCLLIVSTGVLFSIITFRKGEIASGIAGIIIALTILALAIFTFIRNNRALKEGYPLHDERSRRVIEKATSKAFFVSLYLLLIIGYLSDEIINFRDVSQATGIAVGGMAILFISFWAYYNKKEI